MAVKDDMLGRNVINAIMEQALRKDLGFGFKLGVPSGYKSKNVIDQRGPAYSNPDMGFILRNAVILERLRRSMDEMSRNQPAPGTGGPGM